MTQPTDPAFPVEVSMGENGWKERQTGPNSVMTSGLTKLELFAAMAMQGFCANPDFTNAGSGTISELSVERSKALIAALEKEKVRT